MRTKGYTVDHKYSKDTPKADGKPTGRFIIVGPDGYSESQRQYSTREAAQATADRANRRAERGLPPIGSYYY